MWCVISCKNSIGLPLGMRWTGNGTKKYVMVKMFLLLCMKTWMSGGIAPLFLASPLDEDA
jgi:hypothetical protein